MSGNGATWVGLLDLSDDDLADRQDSDLVSVNGRAPAGYTNARVLIRMHGAPLGYVQVPVQPEPSLSARVRAVTQKQLSDSLQLHARRDRDCDSMAGQTEWAAQVACPRRFPLESSTGISIVVCTRDRPESLRACLTALRKIAYSPAEILVVDNAPSSSESREIVEELSRADPRVRYTCEPRPGLSRARNWGLAQAKFDLVAFTDDDVVVDPQWPAALAAAFASDPEVACVTGLVATYSLDTGAERYFDSRYPWGEALEPRLFDLKDHRDESPLYPFNPGIFGTLAAVRRDVIHELGGFDPVLGVGAPGRGGEDLDIFVRVILAGYHLGCTPAALSWHRHRADDRALANQVYSYGYGFGAYVAKRVRTGEISLTVLLRGLGKSMKLAGRMHQASEAGEFKARGRLLALREALGFVAGVVRYYRSAGGIT